MPNTLEEQESIETVLAQADQEGMAPERKLELIDYWANEALQLSQPHFADNYQEQQEFASYINKQAKQSKIPIIDSLADDFVKKSLGDDQDAYKRFAFELEQNQGNIDKYSPEFAPLAKGLMDIHSKAGLDDSSLTGSVKDQSGNPIGDYSVSYSQPGKPQSAKVFMNRQEGGNLLGTEPVGSRIVGGDVIPFPIDFDSLEYLKSRNRQQIEQRLEQLGEIPDDSPAIDSIVSEMDKLEAENAALDKENKQSVASKAADAYIKEYIANKVKENDPKYAEFGDSLINGIWQSAKNTIGQIVTSSVAGMANTLKLLRPVAEELGYPTELREQGDANIERTIGDVNAATSNMDRRENFSRLSVTDIGMANNLEKVTSAITQGGAIAAQFALMGNVAGLGSAFLQGSGAKVGELTAEAEKLRASGDGEAASWLDEHKYGVAARSGGYEVLAERMFAGHNPFRNIPEFGVKTAVSGFGKDFAGESIEGAASATANAFDSYISGISDKAKFLSDVHSIPEQALLEGIGVAIPAGARAAVVAMRRKAIIEKGEKAKAAAENPQTEVPVADNVVAGQPGDHGVGNRPNRDTKRYLQAVYDNAMKYIAQYSSTDKVAPVISANRQGKEIDPKSNVFIVHPEGLRPQYKEEDFNVTLQQAVESDPEFQKLAPAEQEKALNIAKFKLHPSFRAVRNTTFAIGDQGGRVFLVSDSQLLKLHEEGLDFGKHYFFRAEDAEDDQDGAIVKSLIPPDRWISNQYGVSARKNAKGKYVPSKANEQVIIKDTSGAIKTTTVGGKSLHPTEKIATLDDELADAGVTTETRDGYIHELGDDIGSPNKRKIFGRYLTEEGKRKLVENLNTRYGKNNWILKPDRQAQKVGIVRPWMAKNLTPDDKSIPFDVPVMPEFFYIAQERVQEPKSEWRVNIRTNADRSVSVMPMGILGGNFSYTGEQSWTKIPLPVVPKEVRNKITKLVEELGKTELAEKTDTFYGLDVIEDKDGNFKIAEMNPNDDEGYPGSVTMQSAAINGMISMLRGNFSPEAAVTYSAYLKSQAAEALAAKNIERADQLSKLSKQLFDKAVAGRAITDEDIPEAGDLYNQGVFFSNPNTIIKNNDRYLKFWKSFPSTSFSIREVLTAISNNPNTTVNEQLMAKALLDVGSNHPNMDATNIELHPDKPGRYDTESNKITTNNALPVMMHEIFHALSVSNIPNEISVYAHKNITGVAYKGKLDKFLKDKKANPKLKEVIRDYITAVNGLGLNDKVFGKHVIRTGRQFSADKESVFVYYGLTTIEEFISETMTNEDFGRQLSKIKNPSHRFYFRKLLNSVMNWIKSTLFRSGTSVNNLFDKTYNDIMMFIASNDSASNGWESSSLRTYNSNSVNEKLPSGGGFVFGMPKLIQTGKGWVLNGKSLQGKDGLVQEAGLKSIGNLKKTEIELYKYIVPTAFREDGMVDVPLLVEGLKKAESLIRVDVYGQNGVSDDRKNTLDAMRHTWYDVLDMRLQQSVNSYVALVLDETTKQSHLDKELEKIRQKIIDRPQLKSTIPSRPGSGASVEEFLDDIKLYAQLRFDLAANPSQPTSVQGLQATDYYKSISPFSVTEFPVMRIDVSLPPEKVDLEWAGGVVTSGLNKDVLWDQDDLHENLPNTLGWAMAQVVPHPVTQEPVLFIAELQSRWQQSFRDAENYANDPNSVLNVPNSIPNHPLLEIHQSLVLKAAIAQAEKQGINKIAISDAETAMMTEGHDSYKGFPAGTYTVPGLGVITLDEWGHTGHLMEEGRSNAGKQLGSSNTTEWKALEESGVKQVPKQDKGMRLAYDTTLPSIMKRLTGQQGQMEDFGEHKNLSTFAELTVPGVKRGSPVFKTPEGKPRTNAGARVYDVANINYDKVNSITYYANPQDPVNINGTQIKPEFLTTKQKQQLAAISSSIQNKEMVPSEIVEESLSKLSKEAEIAEFQLLNSEWPNAFNSKTNRNWTGFTTLADAKYKLIDWLVDNPNEVDGTTIGSPSKQKQSKNRQALVKKFTKNAKKILEKESKGTLTGFTERSDDVKNAVKRVLDYIANIGDPESITNRGLTAINIATDLFIESDGAIIRGFAAMASKLNTNTEVGKIQSERDRLMANGARNPFGDPISDFRRMQLKAFKTGSSLADFATETLAIFHRPSTRKMFSRFFAPYNVGINAAKAQLNEFMEYYKIRMDALGKTTLLEDFRIGMAAHLTQFEQSGDDVAQLVNAMDQIQESIQRKEDSSKAYLKRDAVIEQEAYDRLAAPIRALASTGAMTASDIIDFVESQLSEKELAYLRLIREPGAQHYLDLDAINQIARGEPIQNWRNYVKRVQYKLNNETMTSAWGEKALKTADSILQPREGLGKGSVFSFNFRPAFDWQLQETAYELQTGVDRVMLFNALTSPAFATAMDGPTARNTREYSDAPRAHRIRAQIGNVHANLKNREVEFGAIMGGALEVGRMIVASKLISLKAFGNQLIPALNISFTKPAVSAEVLWLRISNDRYLTESNTFLKNANPDLYNRMKRFDYVIEQIKRNNNYKKSGRSGMSYLDSVTEKLVLGSVAVGKASMTGLRTALVDLPITLTNGISEVVSAKHVFFTIYIDNLIRNGKIGSVEQFFATGSQLFDKESMSETELEFDSYILSPVQPEFRSEFAQRNEAGKIFANIMTAGLARTAMQQSLKSVTALRDLYHAVSEHLHSPNAYSKAFVKSASKDTAKQILNIAIYYGIGYFFSKVIGSMITATDFVVSSTLAGDDEDKEKWKRMLKITDRIERENQANFTANQFISDTLYFGLPFPGVAQLNPGRELVSTFLEWMSINSRDPNELQKEIDKKRKDKQKILDLLKHNVNTGKNLRDSDTAKLYKSLEYLDYQIASNETHRDRQQDFVDRGISDFVSSFTPVGDPTVQTNKALEFVPDWMADALLYKTEKNKRVADATKESRINTGWWALAQYFKPDAPSQKAARKTTTAYGASKVGEADTKQRQLDEILNMFNQRGNN